MNNAEKYISKQMKSEIFRQAYFDEKLKLDLELQLNELKENIKSNKPTATLIRGVNKLKKTLVSA